MKIKLISFLSLAAVLGGCAPVATSSTSSGTQQPAAQVTSDVVKRQDLTGYSFFNGQLVIPPSAQANAYSPYDTAIITVSTGEGKQVSKGDSIVKLTIPGADANASAARSMVNSAENDLALKRKDAAGPVEDAKRALAQARAAEVAGRQAVDQGGQADVEGLTQTRIAAEEALKQAQSELNKTLEPSKADVSSASSALAAANADAAKGIVRAPISGTVISLKAQTGMTVTAKQLLATIVNFNAARVQGLVPPELKDAVVKHSKVIVAMTGPSMDPLDGEVLSIDVAPPVEGQKSPGYIAVIELKDPQALAQPNVNVRRIGVKTGVAKDVLVVAVGAIVTKDGKTTVDVKNGETWVSTPVEVGITDGALIAIKSGLKEGDTVRVVSSTAPAQVPAPTGKV